MNAHLPPRQLLTCFLLEQIAQQPVEARILLYRALAVDATDKDLRAACTARANEFEQAAARERQMLLDFQRRNA
jgi:hypothetical protein